MAVFTPVSDDDAKRLLLDYQVGDFVSLQGISAGIENTNYFLTTTQGQFVLTLFEVLTHEQLPFYVELMYHLAQKDLPVPLPQTRVDGIRISTLHDKPAIIVTRLKGQWVKEPSTTHCSLAAQTMAKIHIAAQDFGIKQPNLRGLSWWQDTAPIVAPYLTADQETLLSSALAHQMTLKASGRLDGLPFGPGHCDYFRDNVLFAATHDTVVMGGVIDFYFAGWDNWLFDVAVAVNDWCIDHQSNQLDPLKLQAFLRAYHSVRPFTSAEAAVWPDMLQAAALRFWISRLYDYHRPRPAETLKAHDPTHFETVLRLRLSEPFPTLLQDD